MLSISFRNKSNSDRWQCLVVSCHQNHCLWTHHGRFSLLCIWNKTHFIFFWIKHMGAFLVPNATSVHNRIWWLTTILISHTCVTISDMQLYYFPEWSINITLMCTLFIKCFFFKEKWYFVSTVHKILILHLLWHLYRHNTKCILVIHWLL